MASRRHQRRNACLGKRRFESAEQAQVAVRYHPNRRSGAARLHAYRCPFCGAFHIGHRVVWEPMFVEGRRL